MDEREQKLECLKLANGDVEKAKVIFSWVSNDEDEESSMEGAYRDWQSNSDEPPDWDSKLYEVFEGGILYAARQLAGLLDVKSYHGCDGAETLEGDVSGTFANILIAAGYCNEDGDLAKPHEIAKTRPLSPDQSGLGSLEGPFENHQSADEPLAVPSSPERAEQENVDDLRDAYDEGRAAYVHGADIDDNPYHRLSLAGPDWDRGWLAARGPNVYPEGTPRFDYTKRDTSQDGQAITEASGTSAVEPARNSERIETQSPTGEVETEFQRETNDAIKMTEKETC